MSTLAERVKWARETARLSQRELARRAGLGSERHVGLIEAGERPNVELKTLQGVAGVLGVTIGWLANGEGDPPTEESIRAAAGTPDEAAE